MCQLLTTLLAYADDIVIFRESRMDLEELERKFRDCKKAHSNKYGT
jgi:hypothetical protein